MASSKPWSDTDEEGYFFGKIIIEEINTLFLKEGGVEWTFLIRENCSPPRNFVLSFKAVGQPIPILIQKCKCDAFFFIVVLGEVTVFHDLNSLMAYYSHSPQSSLPLQSIPTWCCLSVSPPVLFTDQHWNKSGVQAYSLQKVWCQEHQHPDNLSHCLQKGQHEDCWDSYKTPYECWGTGAMLCVIHLLGGLHVIYPDPYPGQGKSDAPSPCLQVQQAWYNATPCGDGQDVYADQSHKTHQEPHLQLSPPDPTKHC